MGLSRAGFIRAPKVTVPPEAASETCDSLLLDPVTTHFPDPTGLEMITIPPATLEQGSPTSGNECLMI